MTPDPLTPASARQTGERLAACPGDPQVLAAASASIAAGQGKALFSALLKTVEHTSGEAAIRTLMTLLESVMRVRADVGAYLMARLSPVASRRRAHDVFDAIGLWMDGCASAEAARALLQLSTEGFGTGAVRQCEQWAAAIQRRRG